MQPADPPNSSDGHRQERSSRRFTFAPREADNSRTADNVSRDNRRRRNRQTALAIVICLIVVASIGLTDFTQNEETTVQLGIESTSIGRGGTILLEGLSFQGVTKSGKNFIVSADRASESTEEPDRINMASPRARIDTATGKPITINSESGTLIRNSNTMTLSGKVVIVRPDIGYTLTTEEAVADLESGRLVSNSPVRGTGPDGDIRSGGMVIAGEGESVVFSGESTITTAGNSISATSSIVYNREKREVEAEGGVVMTFGGGRQIEAERIFATINEAQDDIIHIRAGGDAEIFDPGAGSLLKASADEIEYSKSSNTAILVGSVTIENGEGSITGERAEIDLASGVSSITSRSGRVGGVFAPKR